MFILLGSRRFMHSQQCVSTHSLLMLDVYGFSFATISPISMFFVDLIKFPFFLKIKIILFLSFLRIYITPKNPPPLDDEVSTVIFALALGINLLTRNGIFTLSFDSSISAIVSFSAKSLIMFSN
jgi:hypothetical protein